MKEAQAPVAAALAHGERLLGKRPDLAAEQAREILQGVPGHPQAQLLLGAALRRQGNAAQAAEVLSGLSRAQPGSALTFQELGLALAALGEDAKAVAALRQAVRIKPALPAAWRKLADLLRLAGEAEQADAAYAESIRAATADPALMAAGACLCDGRLDEAEHLLRAHLRAAPTDVAALRMLAETGTRLGRYEDAEALLRRCLDLAPGFSAARHHLAVVLYRQNRPGEAATQLRLLLGEAPDNTGYRNLLAACLALLGDNQGAVREFALTVEAHPRSPTVWLSYGHTLKTVGRSAEAAAAYRRSLALRPGFGEAYWSLANMKTVDFTQAELAALRDLASRDGLAVPDRLHVHYALGRALELAGEYAESFAEYAEGARLRRGEIHYSAADTTALTRRAAEVFDQVFFDARAGCGAASAAPIFIVGLPRSGSTLIEQILASHPEVEGTMELPDLPQLARGLREGDYFASLAGMDGDALRALGEAYLERTRIYRHLGKPFFIDKLPNNFVHLGLIQLILPRAKIIDARRDAMATCFSAFKQHFARGQHFSYDLRELGLYYRDYVALMAHFDQVLPGRVHRVRHEDLVEDTETEIRRLLAYCGLDFHPSCLRFWETPRAVRTASSEQVRRPISREGLAHWRHYEAYLGPLRAALGEV